MGSKADDWQSAATAPRDGRQILGHCDWEPLTVVVFRRAGQWLVAWDEAHFEDGFELTHWQPLPNPPSQPSSYIEHVTSTETEPDEPK